MGDSRRWAAEQEEERLRRQAQANHPTIHCNRMESPGNVSVSKPATLPQPKPFGAMLTIPEDVLKRTAQEFPNAIAPAALEPSHEQHGVGSHELPDVVSPEEWVDRYTHISACKAILLLEAGFLRSVPQDETWGAHRKFIQTTIDFTFDGRVWDIVKQKYLDVGWQDPIQVKGATELPGKTVVRLHFP